jgi:hypothetical protein
MTLCVSHLYDFLGGVTFYVGHGMCHTTHSFLCALVWFSLWCDIVSDPWNVSHDTFLFVCTWYKLKVYPMTRDFMTPFKKKYVPFKNMPHVLELYVHHLKLMHHFFILYKSLGFVLCTFLKTFYMNSSSLYHMQMFLGVTWNHM